MIKRDKFTYEVKRGETVTLVARITGNAKVKVSKPMKPGPNAPAWTFTIPAENPNRVYVISVEVDFLDPPTPHSRVDLIISGSEGGTFDVCSFTPESPLPECDITRVVE